MDSLKSNSEEISTEIENNEEEKIPPFAPSTATTNTVTTVTSVNNSSSNQETDIAAMSSDLEESLPPALPITQIQTNDTEANSLLCTPTITNTTNTYACETTTAAETLSNQFVTPEKSEKPDAATSPSSLKERLNKYFRYLNVNNSTNFRIHYSKIDCNGSGGHHDLSCSASDIMKYNKKTSLSMNPSLPADEREANHDALVSKFADRFITLKKSGRPLYKLTSSSRYLKKRNKYLRSRKGNDIKFTNRLGGDNDLSFSASNATEYNKENTLSITSSMPPDEKEANHEALLSELSPERLDDETPTTAAETLSNQFVTPKRSIKPLYTPSSAPSSISLKKIRNIYFRSLNCNTNNFSIKKNSLSMTSLTPYGKQENYDALMSKICVERPYNSLKKNVGRNLSNQLATTHFSNNGSSNMSYRCSWGNIFSVDKSSSSHSIASGIGKDDIWPAIKKHYNYLMNTNLLDACREAKSELEGTVGALESTIETNFELLDVISTNVGTFKDPTELRRWLRDINQKLKDPPTQMEANMLTSSELQSHLNKYSAVYHEIESRDRIVTAFIKTATETKQLQQEQQLQLQHDSDNTDASLIAEQTNFSLSSTDDTTTTTTTATTTTNTDTTATTSSGVVCSTASSQQQINPNSVTALATTTPATSSRSKKSNKSYLERLHDHYLKLYLKAFEVQFMFDQLLRKRNSSEGNCSNDDLYSDDDSDDCIANEFEDGATENDLNDEASELESDITHDSLSYNEDLLQQQRSQDHQQQQRKHCHSCDIDENQTINVSSHRHQQNHLQTSSRDCIQTKLLKSTEVSSDDEGWLYTSTAVATNQQQQHSFDGIESLNSNHISRGISSSSSNEIYPIDGGLHSAVASSSETATTNATSAAAAQVIGEDSDKENKEDKAACTTTLNPVILTTNQKFAASTTVIDSSDTNSALPNSNNSKPTDSCSSSSSITSSLYSSNDRLTTTSNKTVTTQIIRYPSQQQHPQYRSEMELQINNNNNNNNHSPMMKENNLVTANSNTTPVTATATNMSHILIDHNYCSNNSYNNNNANCANSYPSSTATSSLQQHKSPTSPPCSLSSSPLSPCSSSSPNDVNGNFEKENIRFDTRGVRSPNHQQNSDNNNLCSHQQQPQPQQQLQLQQLANNNSSPASPPYGQHLLHANVGKRLPPRSPTKSQTSSDTLINSSPNSKASDKTVKQLVLDTKHLVRDEALKTPTRQKHSSSNNNGNNNNNADGVNIEQITSTVKKREVIMPGSIKRVQDWLEDQPSTAAQLQKSSTHHNDRHFIIPPSNTALSVARTDDCEASGEASETDSIPQHCSDTSEVSDSIATCMQTSTNSYGNSTEIIGGSAEPIVNTATSNQSLNGKVVKRNINQKHKSERPWSVSSLSQLINDAKQVTSKVNTINNVQSGLASHSISESALDSLSTARPIISSSSAVAQGKRYDSKGSLKKRKTRKKKLSYNSGKKSDTNSEDNNHNHHNGNYHNGNNHPHHPSLLLQNGECMELQNSDTANHGAGGTLQQQQLATMASLAAATNENEEENNLMRPNFRVGFLTSAYYMTNEVRLGSLAALSTYRNDKDQKGECNTTGTEDHSSFSENAWDNYQEKYNSENYSEACDSDAVRKLIEFGDDYRNFIDSQSDCCSSLSAANNLESFTPPRMDSLKQNESKTIPQDTIASSVDHTRRRRALDLEYERRRKNLEIRRKSCQESLEYHNPKTPAVQASFSTQALTLKNSERFNFQPNKIETATRKLEFGMSHSAQSLRRTSESDTSQRRRKADERRRSSRNLEKCIKLIPATSSSSADDTDDGKEIRNLLVQLHKRLEDTTALKIRSHLLRPEDYTEIISTCRDNRRCLESVLKGPSITVLSSQCVAQSRDLLAAWEDLLGWSENAAAARKMQEDMIVLKHALNRLGNKSSFELLDTEPSIQIAIEALKNEKTQLQTYRTGMLKLNASVHSWLTRQERRLQNALVEQQLTEAAAKVSNELLLLEEKDELESEHNNHKQQIDTTIQEHNLDTTITLKETTPIKIEKTTMITVTDSNGNQVETHHTNTVTATTNTVGTSTATQQQHHPQLMHSSSSCSGSEKNWDLQSLITSETEFHKHLKDEVSDMYSAWDEADARINTQLEVLTSSLIAWRQLECGLSEFQLALGQDRGTLKGLEGALNTGHATPGELAQNVKLVAKLLSEKVNVSQEQLTAVQDYLDPNHILHIAKFTASNGSLSDSGISDGGTTSDGGLSERERRLGVLRRLAKQLESALAPGSEAMKSIAARMESAENELKSLQNTCRDLIVRTAASHQNKKQQMQQELSAEKREEQQQENNKPANGSIKMGQQSNGKLKQLAQIETAANGNYANQSPNKSNRRRNRRNSPSNTNAVAAADMSQSNALQMTSTAAGDGGDDPSDDPSLAYDLDSSDDELSTKSKRGWGWRIARIAVPMQLALFAVYYAANFMQPNCCDNINNLSMSFTPQLRYIRGPPPI